MKLWRLVDLVRQRADLFEVQHPNVLKVPNRNYYIVRIIRFFPDKENAKQTFLWRGRYLGKDPVLSDVALEDFEYRMKIKIADLMRK